MRYRPCGRIIYFFSVLEIVFQRIFGYARKKSFPLDRSRRLRRYVVTTRLTPFTSLMMRVAARPEIHVEGEEVRGHAVDRCHGAQRAHLS